MVECAVATVVANGDPFAPTAVDPTTLKPVCISNLQVKIVTKKKVCNNAAGNAVTCEKEALVIVQPKTLLTRLTQREGVRQYDKANDEILTVKGV